MILLRKRSKPLYWLSENLGLSDKTLGPAVPQNFLTQRKIIDWKTPRILLYESVSDAIMVYGVGGRKLTGKTLGVYRPKWNRPENILDPTYENCPYRDTLDEPEHWCLVPMVMEKVADIKVGEIKEKREFKYGLRNQKNSAVSNSPLPKYSWTEILPEWDKKGKTKKL
jgi:hypothetical protein